MNRLRAVHPFALGFAVFLAMGTAAEPPSRATAVAQPSAADGALDVSPAPGKAPQVAPERTRSAPELPPAARSGVWRAGSRQPADVPANVVVRAAMRKTEASGKPGKRAGAPESEVSSVVEIIWHAPGSTP